MDEPTSRTTPVRRDRGARRSSKSFGERAGAARRLLRRRPRRAARGDRPQRRRQDDAALDPRRDPARRRAARSTCRSGEVGFVPQQAALYRRLTVEENLRLFARLEKVADVEATVERDARARPRSRSAATIRPGRSRAATSSGSTSRSACSRSPAVLLLDEPSTGLDPRQRARLWEFVLGLAGRGTTVIFSTHNIAEAERYGQRLLVLADGQRLFDGTAAELHAAAPARTPSAPVRLRVGLRPLPRRARPLDRRRDALAAAQGPADHAALAAAHGAADRLPDRDRGADRLRALRAAPTSRGSPSSTRSRPTPRSRSAARTSTSSAPAASSARGSSASGSRPRRRPASWSSRARCSAR